MIDSYKKLTLDKYYRIMDLDFFDELDSQVRLISILCDCDVDVVYDMPLDEYHSYVETTAFMSEPPVPCSRIPSSVSFGGRSFEVLKSPERMSAGQYIDYQQYAKEKLGFEYLLSCFLIPKGKKYGEYDVVEVINFLREHVSIQFAVDVCFFFQKKLAYTTKGFLTFLDWRLKRMMRKSKGETKERIRQMRETFRSFQNGDGLDLLTQYLIRQDRNGTK